MSEDQFQDWALPQMKSVTDDRIQNQDRKSMQQCDNMLQQWGQQPDEVDHHQQALQQSVKAQRGLRQRLVAAIANLRRPAKAVKDKQAKVARFRPTRKSSVSSHRTSVPTPLTAPIVQIQASAPGQHVITFEFSGPRGSRPAGSSGAEVYIALGEECPVTDSEFRFAAWATRAPHLMQFNKKDAGRTVHYRLRWINAKGETGPWSQVVSAVIPAMAELVST